MSRVTGRASGLASPLARCLVSGVALLFACSSAVVALAGGAPDAREIPLVDQTGAVFRLEDLRGRPTVLTFVASRCTDACPIANAEFALARAALRREGIRVHLVTVTLDPEYDTPFVMSAAARSFQADPTDWIFASGRPRDVHRLMRSLGIVAQTGKAGYPDVHTTFVYVLDSRQRLTHQLLLSTGVTLALERLLSHRKVAGRAAKRFG